MGPGTGSAGARCPPALCAPEETWPRMTNLSRTIDSQRVFEVRISVLLRSFPFALAGSVVSACVVAYVMLA